MVNRISLNIFLSLLILFLFQKESFSQNRDSTLVLTLKDALKISLEKNQDVKISEKDTLKAEELYDVRVQWQKKDRTSANTIPFMTVKSNKKTYDGKDILIQLGNNVSVSEGIGPAKIMRYARQREVRVDANVDGGTLGEILVDVNKEVQKINVPPGYTISVVGQGEEQAESFANMLLSLAMAIIFVYIVPS